MKNFIFRSVLPTLLTISLFIFAIIFFTLPILERTILDHKKEMIRELTNSAWNILARFEYDERIGTISRQEAQRLAIGSIKNLHYGQGMKDYFWVNDMHPRMIVHPYRPDLTGKDLSEISDSTGMKLFVKFVEIVKNNGAGYVEYLWQWKDDATRVSPKLSYVKGFEPWGWIIGTGVYLNDVHQEIGSIRNHLIFFSSLILLIVSGLLAFLVSGSYMTERRRAKAEIKLKASEEKYRMLVESAGEYMIMSLGDGNLFANNSMLKLLGYSAEEFSGKSISQITEMSPAEIDLGYSYLVALTKGEPVPLHFESFLRAKDESRHRVMISLSSIPQKGTAGFLLIASEVSVQEEKVIQQDRLLEELQGSLLFYHQKVADIKCLPAIRCSENDSLASIGEHFQLDGVSALLITNSTGVKGVLSLASYLALLLSEGSDLSKNIKGVELQAPVCVDEKCLLFDAYLKVETGMFNAVFVQNTEGELTSLINERSFIYLQKYSPTNLLREIQASSTEAALEKASGVLPELARIFINNKIASGHVNRIITDVADAILEKAIELSRQQLGEPPADFCFLVMGSEGRREQTLCTDQDNAIIFSDVDEKDEGKVRNYFEQLGEAVCRLLARCGYSYCTGGIMAKNTKWCQPLSKWKAHFSSWITTLEAEDLLQSKIFFDFRSIAEPEKKIGKSAFLVDQLHQHLEAELSINPRFYLLLARNILQFEPPLGLFGNFILETQEHRADVLNIKSAMITIVDFVRIYALKHGVRERNTHERLKILREKGIFSPQSYDELVHAYTYLMKIRLENHARSIDHGEKPDNLINPDQLTSIDQKILKEIFSQIKNFQVRLSYDFTGMMGAGRS